MAGTSDVKDLYGICQNSKCGAAIVDEQPVIIDGKAYHSGCVPSGEGKSDSYTEWDTEPLEFYEVEEPDEK